MKPFQFFYSFTKGQRNGILALLALVLAAQIVYFIVLSIDFEAVGVQSDEEKQWLALQSKVDSVNAVRQNKRDTIYPFNPNYISDYKGYVLGMSIAEIDRLHAYRESGKFINSAADFQRVMGVHDSLLAGVSLYMRFGGYKADLDAERQVIRERELPKASVPITIMDINAASEEDLVKVYGIGPSYANMILRRRADLGAFVSMEQMEDFTELPADTRQRLKESFTIADISGANKLNVNTASLQQLSRFAYFNRDIARGVITERSMNGKIAKIDELLRIPDFPVDKVKIIALYLEF